MGSHFFHIKAVLILSRIFMFYQVLMWTKWDPIEYYFYCTLILLLIGLKMAVYGRKNVAKYNLIVIIASCFDVCSVLTVRIILYKSRHSSCHSIPTLMIWFVKSVSEFYCTISDSRRSLEKTITSKPQDNKR